MATKQAQILVPVFFLGPLVSKFPLTPCFVQNLSGARAGLLPIAGLWTPVAGVVTASAEAWVAFSSPGHFGIPAALAMLAVTLALIGPGEWSVDARLYGRKHIVHPKL